MKIRDFEKFVKKLLKNIHGKFKNVGYTQLLMKMVILKKHSNVFYMCNTCI